MDRDEIRKACEAATPGPWEVVEDDAEVMAIHMPDRGNDFFTGEDPQQLDDAAFIAGAREWVPALLAENDELRAALRELLPFAAAMHADGPVDRGRSALGDQAAPTDPLNDRGAWLPNYAAPQVAPEPERRIVAEASFADGSVEPILSGDFPRGPSADRVFVDEVAPEPERCPTCDCLSHAVTEWRCPDPWHFAPLVEGEQG